MPAVDGLCPGWVCGKGVCGRRRGRVVAAAQKEKGKMERAGPATRALARSLLLAQAPALAVFRRRAKSPPLPFLSSFTLSSLRHLYMGAALDDPLMACDGQVRLREREEEGSRSLARSRRRIFSHLTRRPTPFPTLPGLRQPSHRRCCLLTLRPRGNQRRGSRPHSPGPAGALLLRARSLRTPGRLCPPRPCGRFLGPVSRGAAE